MFFTVKKKEKVSNYAENSFRVREIVLTSWIDDKHRGFILWKSPDLVVRPHPTCPLLCACETADAGRVSSVRGGVDHKHRGGGEWSAVDLAVGGKYSAKPFYRIGG